MENLKKYGLPIYWVITIISVILIMFYLIVNFGFEKPLTSGYEYFNGIKLEGDNLEDSEEIPIIELNITRSDTNPELNLTEMIITEYTDINHSSYKRYGMQVLGEFNYFCPAGRHIWVVDKDSYSNSYLSNTSGKIISGYFYEIDVDGDIINKDFQSTDSELNNLDVTAGDINFKLHLGGPDGQYVYTREYYSTKGWNAWNEWFNNTKTAETSAGYNVIDLFGYLSKRFETGEENLVKSFDNLDLDKFFTITKDNGSGQFYSLKDVTTNSAYFRVKCTYNKITSHLNAKDHSIIGSIAEDVNYSSGVVNISTPYYSTGVELTLMGNEFLPAKYNNITGTVLTLSTDFRNYLLSLNNLTLNIDIDLDNIACDEEIVGIDLSSFGDLKIANLNINSSETKDFYILGASKYIANATYSSNLNLLNGNGGVYE